MKQIYRFLFHITFGRLRRYFYVLYKGNIKNNKILIYYEDGTIRKVTSIHGLNIFFEGSNSVVKIFKPYQFSNSVLHIGNDNIVKIDSNCHVNDLIIPIKMSDKSELIIGKNFSVVGCHFYLHDEPERKVYIGDDCLFSFGIIIWPSDGHTICDKNGNILNNPENIIIENNCWIGMHTKILKGSHIPKGSILGANSLYVKSSNPKSYEKSCLFVGQPAKVIKIDIKWSPYNTYLYNCKREKI